MPGPAVGHRVGVGYAAPGGIHAAFEVYRTLLDVGKANTGRPDPMLTIPTRQLVREGAPLRRR